MSCGTRPEGQRTAATRRPATRRGNSDISNAGAVVKNENRAPMSLKEIDRLPCPGKMAGETTGANMQRIEKDELFNHLRGFLKAKGINLEGGAYADGIQHGCSLLTEAINATQQTVTRAKIEVDAKLDQLRQSIHEATAPKPPVRPKARARRRGRTSSPSGSTPPAA